jgi:hypothetical protein
MPLTRVSVALASACLLTGCGSGGPERLPLGRWGGQGIALDVEGTGATLELDCAHGALTVPLFLDDASHFEAPGYFVFEGGPTPPTEDRRLAVYLGMSAGETLQLSIHLPDDGRSFGPFSATRGASPRLVKCQ